MPLRLTTNAAQMRKCFFLLVMLSMVFFAYDKYNIKIAIFLLFVFANMGIILTKITDTGHYGMLTFMITVYPVFTVVVSTIMSGGDITNAIRAEYINLFLLLVFIIEEYQIDAQRVLFCALSVLVITILLIAGLDFLGIVDLYANPITRLTYSLMEGQITKSRYAIFYYVIFFNASPLLLFHFTYSLYKKKYLWTVLSFLAILFTGTRANIYIVIAIIPAYIFLITKNKSKKVLLAIICVAIAVMGFGYMYEKIQVINYAKSSGDLIRANGVESLINCLNEDPFYWLFGMGHGTSYFSTGRMAFVNTSELSYLEMIRTVGITGTFPFLLFLFYPVKKIFWSKYRWILLPYGALLATSIVDPFLHTSTSFIMYAIVYSTYYRVCSENSGKVKVAYG